MAQYKITYRPPSKIVAAINQGNLSLSWDFVARPDLPSKIAIEQSVWIEVETTEPQSFEKFDVDFIYPLRNLLTLATGKTNNILAITLNPENVEQNESTH